MSIDAHVHSVLVCENGTGKLNIVNRQGLSGKHYGIAWQKSLEFPTSPEEVTALNGLNIWIDDSKIMLGDRLIGRLEGYSIIIFVEPDAFKAAVQRYHLMKEGSNA